MEFDQYQSQVRSSASDADVQHEIVPMLAIEAHVGSLADAHQRYLREALGPGANRARIAKHLGGLLRWLALVADHHELSLSHIAQRNLTKIDARARSLGGPGLPPHHHEGARTFAAYQSLAQLTDQNADDGLDPLALSVPILGLIGEAGSLLVALKKRYRGDRLTGSWVDFVEEELGDLLWYATAVARHTSLQLEEIALSDAARAFDLKVSIDESLEPSEVLPVLDAEFPESERLPRRLLLKFAEARTAGKPTVTMTLVAVEPNAYPDGPVPISTDKVRGFKVGAQLGDKVTDNSPVNDAYRYHDAIHLGFLAVMGWSPNLRGLLRLKRKSVPDVDENEDGARAVFAEEGLAALLAKRAEDSSWYATPGLVPEETIEIMTTVLEDLEVSRLPSWLWRRAISQGFTVMRALADGGGGYVLADLDQRSLSYSRLPPRRLGELSLGSLV